MHFKSFSFAAFAGLASAQAQQGLNETLAANNQTSALVSLLGQFPSVAQALNGASNITILAPSNDALAKLLNGSAGLSLASDSAAVQALLSYHVLNGTFHASSITNTSAFVPTLLSNSSFTNVTGGQVVEAIKVDNKVTFYSGLLQNSTVVQGDLNFTGGVIHVVDTVLTIPENVTATALAANLTALAGAANLTKLTDTLDTTRDVTIFAPNNAAFKAIGGTLSSFSTDDISRILAYHVVNGTVGYSTGLKDGTNLTTLNGANVTVRVDGNKTFVNGARVVTPNVLVANGVVHVIDNVLNPLASTASPSQSASTGAPAWSSASSLSDVPYTSGQPTPTTSVGAGPGAATSTSSPAAAVPMKTGSVGAAVLFGAGAIILNY